MLQSYPFYITDWRESGAVLAMTAEQRDIYRNLLDICWRDGSLPTDEQALRKMSLAEHEEWSRSWPNVRKQFTERDDRLWNAKVDEKRPAIIQAKKDRSNGGKMRAETGSRCNGKFTSKTSLAGDTASLAGGKLESQPAPVQPPPSPSPSPSPEELLKLEELVLTPSCPPTAAHAAKTNGNGNQHHRSKNRTPEEQAMEAIEAVLQEVAGRIHCRHEERRCSLSVVVEKLTTITKLFPLEQRITELWEIDRRHAGMCVSYEWTKDGRQYWKGLKPWLNPKDGLWRNEPPPPLALATAAIPRNGPSMETSLKRAQGVTEMSNVILTMTKGSR